jgi:hypothetical protein
MSRALISVLPARMLPACAAGAAAEPSLSGEAVDGVIALIAGTLAELAERLTKAIAPSSQSR